ncbi:TlpA disulfide reductase family protein [Achromobacter xylosoxidans]|uniref:TlpA disulfide reductase family protein n=1 Tax=Alcaligenes xylosoxydans xylosoxydans TaxID=85698 RepID=UPI001EEDE2D6|nr:TlpA disulfide reductase family protein [Achromobacter xylosoxidans]
MRRLLLWPCLALCAPPILAGAQPAARPQAGLAWDFSLPALDGGRFVRLSDQQGPVLVNFWSRDCPPCVTELPRLQAFADAHPTWTVLLVSTDTPTAATEFVRAHAITLPVLRPGGNVAALMRSAGNRVGALPFTVATRAARVCDGQLGALSATDLRRIAGACADAQAPAKATP